MPEKTAPKEQPRADALRRERTKKERPPQQDKPERKPAPQKQERPEKAEASSSDGQPKPRRRRRRSGGPRKPSGEGQTPKAEKQTAPTCRKASGRPGLLLRGHHSCRQASVFRCGSCRNVV